MTFDQLNLHDTFTAVHTRNIVYMVCETRETEEQDRHGVDIKTGDRYYFTDKTPVTRVCVERIEYHCI